MLKFLTDILEDARIANIEKHGEKKQISKWVHCIYHAQKTIGKAERDISKEIQFIPFPIIRNLIVIFMKPYPEPKAGFSEILAGEYHESDHLKMIDEQISEKIQKGYHRKLKLEMLQKCLLKCKGYEKQVEELNEQSYGNPLRDLEERLVDIEKRHKYIREENQKERMKKKILERQMQEQRRYRGDSMSERSDQSEIDREKHRKQAQEDHEMRLNKNQEIINLFKEFTPKFEAKNSNYLDKMHLYNEIKEFSAEFQKVISIIWRKQAIIEREEQSKARNIVDFLIVSLKQHKQTVSELLIKAVAELQFFREHVKSADHIQNENISHDFDDDQKTLTALGKQLNENQREVKEDIYHSLRWCEDISQSITDETLSRRVEQNDSEYERFVRKYTDIKEVVNCEKRVKEFNKIISDEEKYLTHHLEVNCGLIVHYKASEEFRNFRNSLQKRTYIRQMFQKQIEPIEVAIKYINEKHNEMYQDACDGRLSRSEVKEQLAAFKKYYEQGEEEMNMVNSSRHMRSGRNEQQNLKQYYVHLIETLKRLVSLCKR